MRDSYGKLMYVLMDTESYHIKSDLKISFVKPILTVSNFLDGRQLPVHDILSDPLWVTACRSISNENGMKSKRELTSEIQEKVMAEKMLLKKYVSGMISIYLNHYHYYHHHMSSSSSLIALSSYVIIAFEYQTYLQHHTSLHPTFITDLYPPLSIYQ